MCIEYKIFIVKGNAFTAVIPLKRRTYVSNVPIDEDIDLNHLTDIVLKVGNKTYTPTIYEDGVGFSDDGTLELGTYNVELTAKYNGANIRAAFFEMVNIVKYNEQSNAQDYVQGSPIVMPPAFIIYNMTDAEWEVLKQELREAIAATEQAKDDYEEAKEAYIEKASALDDVAKQSTLTQGLADIRGDISHIDIDTTTIAKQGTNANATLTATQAAVVDGNDTAVGVGKDVRGEVGTGSDTAAETGTLFAIVKWIKNKVNAITGYALQGSDSTKSITTLDASLGDVEDALDYMEQHIMPEYSNLAKQGSNVNANISDIQAKIGTPASGQPSDLFAAIAAGGGGGGGSAAVPEISVADTGSAATQELAANTLYVFPNRTSDLTLTLGTPVQGEASEYHFIIEVGSTLPTITMPSGLTWKSNDTIAFDTNTTYEVSILDNYAIFVVW